MSWAGEEKQRKDDAEEPERFWPFATRALIVKPRYEDIENHAVAVLNRALNVGRVVAFVGSGVSMSYGRISWKDLVYTVQRDVMDLYEERKAKGSVATTATDLHEILKDVGLETRSEPRANWLPAHFQLCEQLYDALEFPAGERPKGARTFRDVVADLVKDPSGHSRQLLLDALGDADEAILATQARTDLVKEQRNLLAALRKNKVSVSRNANSLADCGPSLLDKIYTPQTVKALCGIILCRGISYELVKKIEYRYTGNDTALLPTHRFVIGALLRLVAYRDRAAVLASATSPPKGSAKWSGRPVPPARDPLLTLLRELHITRFLTTNYDNEIAVMLENAGYVDDAATDTAAGNADDLRRSRVTDAMAPPVKTSVFANTHSSRLTAFAVQDRGRTASVMHLHGRAGIGDNGSIIATTRDYQNRYLRDDETRPLIANSVDLTFSSNPMLFVGSGMGEDDILRPLGEFMATPGRSGDGATIAFLPMMWDRQSAHQEKISLLQRFGVHAIHFGQASDSPIDEPANPPNARDWLSHACAIKREVDQVLEKYSDAGKSLTELSDLTKLGAQIADGLGRIDEAFDRMGVSKSTPSELHAPKYVEKCSVKDYPDLSLEFEVQIINLAIAFLKHTKGRIEASGASLEVEEKKSLRRAMQAHRLALDGALSSILGCFLSARLIRASIEWKRWRRFWFELPASRLVEPADMSHDSVEFRYGIRDGWYRRAIIKMTRHALALHTATDAANPRKRFYIGAPSETFNGLTDALNRESGAVNSTRGRRTLLLIARRGVGKGYFFSALQDPEEPEGRLATLLRLFGGDGKLGKARWAGSAFFNLSFSNEVASVFDSLIDFLKSICGLMSPSASEEINDNWGNLSKNRIGQITAIMSALHRHARSSSPRALVAFNAVHTLFDSDGEPKNFEITKVFEALLGEDVKGAPVDFVFVTGERTVPRYFRALKNGTAPTKASLQPVRLLGYEFGETAARFRLEERARNAGLAAPSITASTAEQPVANFAHFLRPAKAYVMTLAFFPSVAVTVAIDIVLSHKDFAAVTGIVSDAEIKTKSMQPTPAAKLRLRIRRSLHGPRAYGLSRDELFPRLTVAAAIRLCHGKGGLEEVLDQLGRPDSSVDACLTPAFGHLKIQALDDAQAKAELCKRFIEVSDEVDARLRDLYHNVGRGRFVFTALLAAAYEFLVPALGASKSRPYVECRKAAMSFLRQIEGELRGLTSARRDDIVIGRILSLYEQRHAEELPLPCDSEPKGEIGTNLFILMRTLIWHLGIIGEPVGSDVLSRCPDVMRAARIVVGLPEEPSISNHDMQKIEKAVYWAVDILENRCLVFRLSMKGRDPPSDRWSVHRLVQRHVFRTVGAPFVEVADVDHFGVTIYSSQPNDLPRISGETYTKLRRTTAALSGYPDHPELAPIYKEMEEPALKQAALRAALGVLRSAYSVSVLSRLDTTRYQLEEDGADMPDAAAGLLEDHRRQVRWLLDRAKGFARANAPFYAEELVWLYNECGVLCLAQGALEDASALFSFAQRAADEFERSNDGPLHTRVLLNRSVADIDRGRLAAARDALSSMADPRRDEHPALKMVARGYLGLISHLTGYDDEAEAIYDDAIRQLTKIQRSRAASIFSRHSADLWRRRGDLGKALDRVGSAIDLANIGGHEDIRHSALLSQVKIRIADEKYLNFAELHRQLDTTERYARVLGMPRLSCEVAELRARIHYRTGDMTTAATAANRAVGIAARNGMTVRNLNTLLLLARINGTPPVRDAVQPLLDQASEIQQLSGCHYVKSELHELRAMAGM